MCGARTPQGSTTAQYRIGRGPAELTVDDGRFANVPYSGGGEAQIAFENSGTRYIVFSRVVRTNFAAGEPNNPRFDDGVIVEREGKAISTFSCEGDVEQSVDISAGENYGEVADELFYTAF